jgi:hypothetical protein
MDTRYYIEMIVSALVVSLGSGGIASLAVVYLAKNWISERLKHSIEHEYAQKLETFKAELKAQQEVAIEKIRSMHSLAATSFVESRKAAQERELQGIEAIWQAILQIPPRMPPWVARMDMLTSQEWKEAVRINGKKMGLSSFDEIVNHIFEATIPAESARLFAGEYAYALLYAFRAVSGRILFLHERAERSGTDIIWHQDPATRQLLGLIFDGSELDAFDRQGIGHYAYLGNVVKQKFVNIANSVASGTKAAQEALKQAHEIVEASNLLSQNRAS